MYGLCSARLTSFCTGHPGTFIEQKDLRARSPMRQKEDELRIHNKSIASFFNENKLILQLIKHSGIALHMECIQARSHSLS